MAALTRTRSFSTACLLAAIACVTACADIVPPANDIPEPDDMLWQVIAAPKGLTMAVGDVAQLDVEAYNVYGDRLPIPTDSLDSASVTFRSADTARLDVSQRGLLTARAVTSGTSPIKVFVTWTHRDLTKADTLYVKINAVRPAKPVEFISIHPLEGDSAKVEVTRTKTIQVRAYANDSTLVSGVYAYIDTKRRRQRITPDDINPQTGVLTIREVGRFWLYATSWVYGTLVRDSVEWTGTYIGTTSASIYGVDIAQVHSIVGLCARITVANLTYRSSRNTIWDSMPPVPLIVRIPGTPENNVCAVPTSEGTSSLIQSTESVPVFFSTPGLHTIEIYDVGPPERLRHTIRFDVRRNP